MLYHLYRQYTESCTHWTPLRGIWHLKCQDLSLGLEMNGVKGVPKAPHHLPAFNNPNSESILD